MASVEIDYSCLLPVVAQAEAWLDSLVDRPVVPRATVEEIVVALGQELPAAPTDPAGVVDLLGRAAEPGLTAMPSGRFFGFVTGGVHPAALAADWLVSAWDQNTHLRAVSPTTAAVEQIAGRWLLGLLGLPAGAAVGFTTGATMANFTCLAAARDSLLAGRAWDLERDGLFGAPRIRVLVGAEGHASVGLVLRYLGFARPEAVAVDDQGRIDVSALTASLAAEPGVPTIVVLQAGNVHSGAFDPFVPAIEAARAAGAWVHVDGAFGLFAAASTATRSYVAGVEGADSWVTDAHKTLNVAYDCGIAIVRDPAALTRAMGGGRGAYVISDGSAVEPQDTVPEMSRRARGVPVWAVLRSLGREGVGVLVERMVANARALAEGASAIPGARVLNEVGFTQVSIAFEDDERTAAIGERLMSDGRAWITASRWRGEAVLRIAVSSWRTTPDDVRVALDALHAAAAGR